MGNFIMNKVDKDSGEASGEMNLEIRVYPIPTPKGNTKAFASVSIDSMFGVHGISVVEGKNGLFVSMPQTKDSKGDYRDIFHPVTSEGRKALNEAILNEYTASLDALVEKQESTIDKMRETAATLKDHPATDTPVKPKGRSKNRKGEEL